MSGMTGLASPAAEEWLQARLGALASSVGPWPFSEDAAENEPVISWRQLSSKDTKATGNIRCLTDLTYEVCVYQRASTLVPVAGVADAIDAALDVTGAVNFETEHGLVRVSKRVGEASGPYRNQAGETMQKTGGKYVIRVGIAS